MTELTGLLAFAAFMTCTIGPIIVGVSAWKLVALVRRGWLVHLSFVPTLIGLEWFGSGVYFKAIGDNGDGPPGAGLAMVPSVLILLVTIVCYYVALGSRTAFQSWRRRRDVRLGRPPVLRPSRARRTI